MVDFLMKKLRSSTLSPIIIIHRLGLKYYMVRNPRLIGGRSISNLLIICPSLSRPVDLNDHIGMICFLILFYVLIFIIIF